MTHSPGTAVAFERVSKVFETAKGEFTALEDITFTVPTGGISGVVGTSGAGKSTLIRTVNGLETPTSGTVTVLGRQPAELSPKQLRELRREVSMVFQNYNLLETKTVAENVATPLLLSKTPKGEVSRRVAEVLEMVGLAERADHKPRQLSGGQRQRVGIARALVTNPSILLCDEPTSALDPLTTTQILELLRDINAKLGVTILLITHQMDVVARLADSVAVLEAGRLVESGPVAEVFANPQATLTQRFVETVIPRAIPDSVRATIDRGDYDEVVQLIHTGSAVADVFSELARRFNVEAHLLSSAETELADTSVGATILGLRADGSLNDAVAWLDGLDGITANRITGKDA
ncbi:ATP-binding cassette domain-containing protein [Corynebacterium imitans]|uniref:methionine ABC transporter ATP-binding protein n=1 Tax=Corynebacterium imitans TaxID=156978 RepID=UPI00254D03C1|nr:ATP-binding cassette domain-containing protein [Corynebacterium imitans]MDK8305475.1 ATP-binding cassette domain-containing protein [Corynebacterium imitans]MDK8636660.1 ATP-binding cassette domain-containing protein [Corynebacterium imitans]MDK8771666.1 ATP-binding cassette domain-containing protein [Corynebacterium imitans]